jgi:hypothetical protein
MESLINTIEIRTINIRINSQPVALRIRSSLSPQEGVTANKIRCLAIITLVTRSWDFQEARESCLSTINLGCGSDDGICR